MIIGLLTGPGAWFAGLRKPSFNPPSWVFAPVWTTLYIMIAVAGWRTWRRWRAGAPYTALYLWGGQLVLNFAWSPLFFGAHRIDLALRVIVVLLATIVAFIVVSRNDRVSALLFVPYGLWVAFATLLNAAFSRLNGAG